MRKKGPHKAIGLYAHITWHTWRRQPSIADEHVAAVKDVVLEAGKRCRVRVHALAILSDHVHAVVSYPPDAPLGSFIRHAKSESARRINLARGSDGQFRWCRGYYAGSLSRSHVALARRYLAKQHLRHPDRIPTRLG